MAIFAAGQSVAKIARRSVKPSDRERAAIRKPIGAETALQGGLDAGVCRRRKGRSDRYRKANLDERSPDRRPLWHCGILPCEMFSRTKTNSGSNAPETRTEIASSVLSERAIGGNRRARPAAMNTRPLIAFGLECAIAAELALFAFYLLSGSRRRPSVALYLLA